MHAMWTYLKYVMRHKWFVFLAGQGSVGLWQLVIHDWHKFLPGEFLPYARHFYGPNAPAIREAYYHNPHEGHVAFNTAWLKHLNRGPHHWQHWMLQLDSGPTMLIPMPEKYIREMLADWQGAGRAQGFGDDTRAWYARNREKIQLHPQARDYLHCLMIAKWGAIEPTEG